MSDFWRGFEKRAMVPMGAFASGASRLTNAARRGAALAAKHPARAVGGALGVGAIAGRMSAPAQQQQI